MGEGPKPVGHDDQSEGGLTFSFCLLVASPREGRYQVLANNNLQIRQVTKADEGVYRCEASVEARGEIDFVDIAVVVNGECAAVRQNASETDHERLVSNGSHQQSGSKHHKGK